MLLHPIQISFDYVISITFIPRKHQPIGGEALIIHSETRQNSNATFSLLFHQKPNGKAFVFGLHKDDINTPLKLKGWQGIQAFCFVDSG